MEHDLLLQEKIQQLKEDSQKDSLTGLWNRSYITEKVDEYLMDESHQGTMFMIDLDDFKLINDNYGHLMGDACLIELSGVMRDVVRDKDIVCRLGGDEFIVFISGKLSKRAINDRANRLLNGLNACIKKLKVMCVVTASIGVSSSSETDRDFKTLYNNADRALYMVKNNGKNSFCVYSEDGMMNEKVFAKENHEPDIALLKRFIAEREKPRGAYSVEYESFRKIYQFMARYIGRTGAEVQVILFTVSDTEGNPVDVENMPNILFELERIIKESLRVGDVATNYSSSQFIILLMDANCENACMVADRIKERFTEAESKFGITLKYDVDRIKSEK